MACCDTNPAIWWNCLVGLPILVKGPVLFFFLAKASDAAAGLQTVLRKYDCFA
jgi:hypothetical protein